MLFNGIVLEDGFVKITVFDTERGGWCNVSLNQVKNYSRLNLPVTREGEY